MLNRLHKWREKRLIASHPIAEPDWRLALEGCAPAQRLGASDQAALRVLATRFLRAKAIEPVQGLDLNRADRVLLATHACLPILKLGMGWYRGWHSVIVYPGAFMPRRPHTDSAGVVHDSNDVRAGEAWLRGPVIISWDDVTREPPDGRRNVIVHELAHKLDMLQGPANGYPPLHRDMRRRDWQAAFRAAWDQLQADRSEQRPLPLDPYALTNPAEFFAVASEQFFQAPAVLEAALPALHQQLARFYRQ